MLIHRKVPTFQPTIKTRRQFFIQLIKLIGRLMLVVLVTSFVLFLKIRFEPLWRNANYILLISATIISSFIGGFTGGMISTLLGITVVNHFFHPLKSLTADKYYLLQTVIIIVQGAFLSLIISSLKKNNVAEYRLRKWFEITLSSIGDGVIATDDRGYIVFMNKVAQNLTKWEDEDAYGRHLSKVFSVYNDRKNRKTPSPVAEVIKQGKAIELENHSILIARDKSHIVIEDSAAPITDSEGNVTGVILVFRDQTAKKEREYLLNKANQRVREIFESITDAFFSLDGSGAFIYVNNRAQATLKKARKELLGNNIWDVFPQAKETQFGIKLKHVMTNKKPVTFEEYFSPLKSWYFVSVYPMKNGLAVYFNDISKRKKMEVQLRNQQEETVLKEQHLQSIIDGTPDIVLVKDKKGRYITANKSLEKMLGVSKEEIKGKTDYDFFSKERADEYRMNDNKILEKGVLLQAEEESEIKGRKYIFLANKFPLYDGEGKIYATCGVSTDITERKLLEQKKDEFMTVASHELKTPLTSIKAYVQILERIINDMGSNKAKIVVTKTNIYINRLHSLITDLLDISKIQAGKLDMNYEDLNFRELITQSVEGVQLFNPDRRIMIGELADLNIKGDRDRLEQVIVNFLTNAIKYSPGKKDILIRTKITADEIQVGITDYGVGIAPEKQAHLFKRFYRVEDTEKQFSGLGIGLYIASEIVKRHNGKVWVKSSPRKGSTFYFSLPLRRELQQYEKQGPLVR